MLILYLYINNKCVHSNYFLTLSLDFWSITPKIIHCLRNFCFFFCLFGLFCYCKLSVYGALAYRCINNKNIDVFFNAKISISQQGSTLFHLIYFVMLFRSVLWIYSIPSKSRVLHYRPKWKFTRPLMVAAMNILMLIFWAFIF